MPGGTWSIPNGEKKLFDSYAQNAAGYMSTRNMCMSNSLMITTIPCKRENTEGHCSQIWKIRYSPLIRYENGDRGRRLKGQCPCGRTLPMIDSVKGRESGSFVLPSGKTINGEF